MNYTTRFPEICRKLSVLEQLDAERQVFAADKHQYQLNPPISVTILEDLESQIGYPLPDPYRQFILELGDGGAGPSYGIFPFADLLKKSPTETLAKLKKPFPVPKTRQEMDALAYWPPGALAISDMGCCATTWLILSGPERGFVWWQNPDAQWGPELSDDFYIEATFSKMAASGTAAEELKDPWLELDINLNAPKSMRLQFLDWYVKWLDDSIAQSLKQYHEPE